MRTAGFLDAPSSYRGRDSAADMAYERGGARARIGSQQGLCRRGQRRAAASHRIRQDPGGSPGLPQRFPRASAGHRQARSPAIHSANGGRDAGLVSGLSRTNARHRARSPAVIVAAVVSRAPPLPCSRDHPFLAQSAGARRPAAQSPRPSPLRIGRRIRPRSRCDRVCVLDETCAESASAPAYATDST
jgi:hypothetical protein